MQVIQLQTAANFIESAGEWLEQAEAENNLILGISEFFKTYSGQVKVQPYFLVVKNAGAIFGAALMTPPRRLLITRMPDEGVIALADFFTARRVPVPGVLGPRTEAKIFADYWARDTERSRSEERRVGKECRL